MPSFATAKRQYSWPLAAPAAAAVGAALLLLLLGSTRPSLQQALGKAREAASRCGLSFSATAGGGGGAGNDSLHIPKILHQVYIGDRRAGLLCVEPLPVLARLRLCVQGPALSTCGRTTRRPPGRPMSCRLPETHVGWVQSCRLHYNRRAGWRYMFWNESMAEQLVAELDPSFLKATASFTPLLPRQLLCSPCRGQIELRRRWGDFGAIIVSFPAPQEFKAYPYPVQKGDAIRYFIMKHIGGQRAPIAHGKGGARSCVWCVQRVRLYSWRGSTAEGLQHAGRAGEPPSSSQLRCHQSGCHGVQACTLTPTTIASGRPGTCWRAMTWCCRWAGLVLVFPPAGLVKHQPCHAATQRCREQHLERLTRRWR